MAYADVIPMSEYMHPRFRRRERVYNPSDLGAWGYPVQHPELGDLPASDYILQAGQLYTFIVRLSGRPSETTLLNTINNNNKEMFFTTLSVTSSFGSADYNIAIRMKKTMSYTQLMNLIKLWISVDLGYTVQEIDFKSGAASAPSIFQTVASTVTAPVTGVAQVATGITSNLKWIALAGLGILGIWAALPLIRSTSKQVAKKLE